MSDSNPKPVDLVGILNAMRPDSAPYVEPFDEDDDYDGPDDYYDEAEADLAADRADDAYWARVDEITR